MKKIKFVKKAGCWAVITLATKTQDQKIEWVGTKEEAEKKLEEECLG